MSEVLDFVLAREAATAKHERPRCYGVSSDALTLYALGKGERPLIPGTPSSSTGGSWHGDECGRNYPHDESDLAACELTYEMAPDQVREIMLPVLDEFRRWVREGVNRHGVKLREPRSGGMSLHGPGFEVRIPASGETP